VPVGFLPTDLEGASFLAVDGSLTGRSSERTGAPALISSHSQARQFGAFAVASSEHSFQSSESNPIQLSSASQSQISIHAPVPDKAKTSFSSSFLGGPPAPILLGPGQSSRRSVSAAAPSNPKPSLPNRASSEEPQEGSLDMAGFGPSWSSQARAAELNAAAAARARSVTRELDDLNSLPSSQPIPLSALSSRAHTRNKGSKSWKPFLLDDAQDSSGNVNLLRENPTLSSGTYAAVSSYKPDTAKINQANNPLRGVVTVNYSGSNKLQEQSKENSMNTGQQFWIHGMESDLQANPLGQFGSFNTPFDDTASQYYYYTPAIPFSGGLNQLHGSGHMMPVRINPTKQEEKSVTTRVQETAFCQNLPCEDPFMPEPSFHAYGPDLYTAANQSQVRFQEALESSLYNHQRQGQMDLHAGPQVAHDVFSEPEDERYIDYAPIRPPGVFPEIRSGFPVTTTNPVIAITVPQTQTPTSLSAKSSVSAVPSVPMKAKSSESRECYSVRKLEPYDAKKEMAAFLNSVVEASKSNVARTVLHDPLKTPPTKGQPKKERQSDETPSLEQRCNHTIVEENSLPLVSAVVSSGVSKTVSFLEPSHAAAAEPEQTCEQTVSQRESAAKSETDLSEVALLETKPVDEKAVKFPPPGLPPPGLEMPRFRSLERAALENSRVAESNRWFHTDGRGEQQLRQYVADIARTDAERRKKLRGSAYPLKEDRLAELTTLLLGNVIANLQSYLAGDRKEQAGNFANFGIVPFHCCEPPHGGRCSYFDRDPLIHQWRLPPGRAFTNFSLRATSGRPLETRFLTSPIFRR